jgi:hypothetical protein
MVRMKTGIRSWRRDMDKPYSFILIFHLHLPPLKGNGERLRRKTKVEE